MINWIEATTENIKEYFYDKEKQKFEQNLCTDFCFLADDGEISATCYPRPTNSFLYFGNRYVKVTHFCTIAEYEAILPKEEK